MDLEAQRLVALEEDLKRDLEAIQRVKKLMSFKNGDLAPTRSDPRQQVIPLEIQVEDSLEFADGADVAKSPSLRGTIENIVNANPSVRWTTQKMLSHLQKTGYDLRAQKPIYSVGQALQKLVEGQKIRIVQRGTGSAPNIYKAKVPQGKQPEGAEQEPQK